MKNQNFRREVPPLKELAARAVDKLNPNLFFQFHANTLDPDIYNKYVLPRIEAKIEKAEENYFAKEKVRSQKVSDEKERLTHNDCFVKTMGCLGGIIFVSIYLGVSVPILEITKASLEKKALCYTLTFIPFLVGSCFGICFSGNAAKKMVEFSIPKTKAEVVDLEDGAVDNFTLK
ncbi:hypothetical protein [Legionella brunensis]|uniref:Transmembrane protein n=1 Tax=Legionella brunensis TaxID=29422 RepID=A0A0W0SUY1_9GAMM|nr:hypothetical protein [Legionella brunensis]KTC87206.1 hypothetical protein Lbru_0024 [Legionella brunensis]